MLGKAFLPELTGHDRSNPEAGTSLLGHRF